MPTVMRRKSIKNAIQGFLGTYISRNTDFDGYWLHGQLLTRKLNYSFNLSGWACHANPLEETAWRLAITRFTDQLKKCGLRSTLVRQATLEWSASGEIVAGARRGMRVDGRIVVLTLRCELDNGQTYEGSQSVFVAPHDPAEEHRSVRGLG